VGIFDKLFAKKPTREEFAKIVMAALEKGGARDLRLNPEDGSIRVGSSNTTFYIDNAFRDYCAAESGARSGVVEKYASTFVQAKPMPKDFASAKDSLLPVVKDPAYFSLSMLMLKADGKDTSKLNYVTKDIVDGLVAGVACDTEHSIMNVNVSTLQEWGVSFEEALEIAILNLRDRTSTAGMKEIVPGLYVSRWGDCYDSARILIPDVLHRLSLNGDPVIFAPNRDQLWVTGKYDKAGIGAMLTHGKQSHFEQGHSLSPNLYAHSDGKWELHVPEDEELKKLSVAMSRQRDGMDYAQQKGYLDKLHQKEKNEVFVATCQIYKRKDESLFSRCVWTNGVDALLPETDLVVFMVDLKTKELISVGWKDATAIVGSLMEPQLEMVPKRYRARKFPNAEQLARLREVAQKKPGGSGAE
jgi:hypothetical protein